MCSTFFFGKFRWFNCSWIQYLHGVRFFWWFMVACLRDLPSLYRRMTQMLVLCSIWWPQVWAQQINFPSSRESSSTSFGDMFAATSQKASEVPSINRMHKLRLFYTHGEQEHGTTENACRFCNMTFQPVFGVQTSNFQNRIGWYGLIWNIRGNPLHLII